MDLAKSQDVVVIGGGPAGLSAALALGRQRRSAVVCDTNAPANAASAAVHGALGFDGVSPPELRRRGREECARYPSLSFRDAEALAVEPVDGGFRVTLADAQELRARKVILACGRRYELPPIPGARDLFGSRVLHCPFCHGWEVRGKALAVIGGDAQALQLAVMLRRLTDQLILFTNGTHALNDDQLAQLRGARVAVHEQPVTAIAEAGDGVELAFADEGSERRDAVFLHHIPGDHQLVTRLNLDRRDDGRLQVDETGQTSIPGLYAAGDLCTFAQVTLAMSTGAVAGSAASVVLAYEDLAKKPSDE
jgi:thioredoxin reductase